MDRLDYGLLGFVLDLIDISELVASLSGPPARTGRKPYDREPIVRALVAYHYVAESKMFRAFHSSLAQTPALSQACGFTDGNVPSRPTFSRVHTQLAKRLPYVRRCIKRTLRKIKKHRPDLGKEVAVDSTVVKTYANPNRTPHSDPKAGWAWVKNTEHPKGKWVYGYKAHTVADANYDIPLAMSMTPANVSDTKLFKPLMRVVWADGYRPEVVTADRGYDAGGHSRWLHQKGVAPVIHKRRPKSGVHRRRRPDGTYAIYTTHGIPTCECGHVRPYLRTDPETGRHLYGRIQGCDRGGKLPIPLVAECDHDVWVDPDDDPRLHGGSIRRGSREWLVKYDKRWSVERVFGHWKDVGYLRHHYFRGRDKIELHTLLQMLAHLVYILAKLEVEAAVEAEEAMPMAA